MKSCMTVALGLAATAYVGTTSLAETPCKFALGYTLEQKAQTLTKPFGV